MAQFDVHVIQSEVDCRFFHETLLKGLRFKIRDIFKKNLVDLLDLMLLTTLVFFF